MKNVLIIGAGFAGLNAATILSKRKDMQITIVDRRNHHLFQPLLYQVATAGLSPADIATPIRNLFSGKSNVHVVLDEVVGIDLNVKKVTCREQILQYDFLVVACGANHSYFGSNEWEEFAPGLKTLEQATEIRRRVLTAFEEAEKVDSPVEQTAWTTFIVVGGGPTGVELAGAIADLSRNTIKNDFRNIDPARSKIMLIEAGKRVLAGFDERLSEQALKDLKDLGVDVQLNTRVVEMSTDGLTVDQGGTRSLINSRTAIWAPGVSPSITGQYLKAQGVELDRSGRVIVCADLALAKFPEVFVIGDQAHVVDEDQKPLPGLAPVAMQQGRHAARNIIALIDGKTTEVFEYFDKGIMATIGRKRAVVQTGRLRFTGWFAWATWLFIHIYYLIGFRNRIFVFMQWTWSYLTFSRGARLIIGKDWHLKP